jgi:hypothetical protein
VGRRRNALRKLRENEPQRHREQRGRTTEGGETREDFGGEALNHESLITKERKNENTKKAKGSLAHGPAMDFNAPTMSFTPVVP